MKLQLLPSSIDENGKASARQHLLTIIIDDCVAIDAGCLALSCTDLHRRQIRDVVLTHTHLDHIAGLPLFIDDLFATLQEPIRIHATREMIDILERDIFNWSIYPRFSELSNDYGPVIEYFEFKSGTDIAVRHLSILSIPVNHKIKANGFIVKDEKTAVAISGDTAETDEFWRVCNSTNGLSAILVECAFPNEFAVLAEVSNHLTPARLRSELMKLSDREVPVYIINLKPMYRDKVIEQITKERLPQVNILDVGKVYEF